MNIRRGLFRLWIVVSAVWVLGSGIVWYQNFAFEQTQIAALDECGKIYPAPESEISSAGAMVNKVFAAVAANKKVHTHCVPFVGTISPSDFLSMREPDRKAVRHDSENAIRSVTQDAVVFGAGVPVVPVGFRPDHGMDRPGFPPKPSTLSLCLLP